MRDRTEKQAGGFNGIENIPALALGYKVRELCMPSCFTLIFI